MTQSRERSYGANTLLNLFGWAVPAIAALVAIPITVRGLGADQYGLLSLTAAITGYLGLMEMGLGSAIMRYLSYYRALNQGRPMRSIIWFAVRWFGSAGLVGGAFLWVAAPWLSSSVLKVPPELLSTSIIVVRITGASFLVGLLVSVGTAIPQTFLRYDIAAAMSGSIGTVSVVGPAVIVTLGYEIVPVTWFSLGLNLVALALYSIVGYRLMHPIPAAEGPPWKEIRRKVLSFAGLVALNSISYTLARQTNRLVVGIAGGVGAAAYYQVPYTMASRVNDMISRVAQVLFPTASALFAKGDVPGVRQLYLRASRLFFVLNFSVTMGLCVVSYPLLRFWVGETYAQQGAMALAIFSLSMALSAATQAAFYVNMSAGRPGINAVYSNTKFAILLLASYPLTALYGINGAALAWLVAALTVPFFLLYSNRRVLELSSWLVWRRCHQPTVIGTCAAGAAGYFIVRPVCHSLASTLVGWCIITLTSIAASGLFGGVSREDLAEARRLLGAAWRPVRALLK